MKFIIFHGSFGSIEDNWFLQLKESLDNLGQEVILMQFPVESWKDITEKGLNNKPQKQNLTNWLDFFDNNISKKINLNDKLCFIGHSIGPVFILHILEKYDYKLDCAIFVSPFMDRLVGTVPWQYDKVNSSFYRNNFNFTIIKKRIPLSYVLYSNNDPYVPDKFPKKFAQKMGSSIIEVKNAGHLNSEVNLNEFPLVLELCKSRLDLSLYQKYMAHRRELYAVDYRKGRNEEMIYLEPHEVFDEGVFHFRNLKKSGFCTLYTGTNFWDKQSKYMTESRKAAKRIKNVTRVYVVEKLSDLKRTGILEQIRLDISSCISVYLVMLNRLTDVEEIDFGIWDGDYTCHVHFDKNKNASEVKLSSRKVDLKKAMIWQKKVLESSVRIKNTEIDINKFISREKLYVKRNIPRA